MSAIWGAISLDKGLDRQDKRIEEISRNMKLPYEECVINRFEEGTFDNGFFACGLQYFKENSEKEILPISDNDGIVFTGDIVLNAREKLISEIKQSDKKFDDIENAPDGTLAYMAWKIWGEEFTDHIQGLFSIAVYNTKTGDFYLFTDHVGARCIYYCVSGGEIYFSTLIKPILKVIPEEGYGLNDKFITACEATTMPIMFMFPELTAFNNIYLVPRGNYLRAYRDGDSWETTVKEYWNPSSKSWQENRSRYKVRTDKELRALFRNTFFDSVKDAIDTDGEIAATISSGLDSSSVATVAAKQLPEGKKLFGYTAVPVREFKYDKDAYTVPDETEGVKKIIAGYGNIVHSSESCEGISAFTEMDKFVHRYEIPGKAFVNHIWMDYIASKAKSNGCKVLLNGQFGNYTISNGNIMELFFQELFDGNLGEAKRQLAELGRQYGVPRKVLLDLILTEISTKAKFSLGFTKDFDEIFDDIYVRKDLMKKYRIKNRLREMFRYNGYSAVNSSRRMSRHMFNFNLLQTQGLYDTKLSLYVGILLRDPTRDKRVIEICSILPPNQFTNNGIERRLVREYLNDFIPDEVRLDLRHRGLQSADMALRLKLYGEEKRRTELNPLIERYMNIENVKELLAEELVNDNTHDTVRVLALNSFLNEYEKRSHK